MHLDEERSSSLQPSSSHDGTTLTPVALETSSKGGCGADGDSTLSKVSRTFGQVAVFVVSERKSNLNLNNRCYNNIDVARIFSCDSN